MSGLAELQLVWGSPGDLEMNSDGGGEFASGFQLTDRGVAKVEACMSEEAKRQAQELTALYEGLGELLLVVGAEKLREGIALGVEAAKLGIRSPSELEEMARTHNQAQMFGLDYSDIRAIGQIIMRGRAQ